MTGMWLLMAEGCSEGTGKEGSEEVFLYVKKWIECKELSLKNSQKQVQSL